MRDLEPASQSFFTAEGHRIRLVAVLVRQLLAAESFITLADLTDALKWRCARLHIRVTPDDITKAYRLLASNVPLVHTTPSQKHHRDYTDHGLEISKTDAARILQQMGVTVP